MSALGAKRAAGVGAALLAAARPVAGVHAAARRSAPTTSEARGRCPFNPAEEEAAGVHAAARRSASTTSEARGRCLFNPAEEEAAGVHAAARRSAPTTSEARGRCPFNPAEEEAAGVHAAARRVATYIDLLDASIGPARRRLHRPGREVKPGITVSCEAGDGSVIHLSQAALGETKKGSENVVVFVKVGEKKLAIGTLSADKHPQISCDLIFSEAFELSHSSKSTNVFLCGYKAVMPDMFKFDSGEDEDEELETDEIPVKNNETEKSAAKDAKDGKKDKQDDDNESDDSETSDSETSSGTDDSMSEDDSSDEDDMSSGTDDSEDEETPVKPEVGKKRAVATALKTPGSDKKAKISTPKKETGDKKSVHVATPHPAKQASKTPADGKRKEKAPKTPADSKATEKSPKSGSHSCKSCSKTFNSAAALESHQKAK